MLLDSRDTSLISVQPLSRQCSGDVPSSLHPITMRQRRRTLKPESLNPRFRDPFHPQTQTLTLTNERSPYYCNLCWFYASAQHLSFLMPNSIPWQHPYLLRVPVLPALGILLRSVWLFDVLVSYKIKTIRRKSEVWLKAGIVDNQFQLLFSSVITYKSSLCHQSLRVGS